MLQIKELLAIRRFGLHTDPLFSGQAFFFPALI
jgi:hypothetical protein